MNVHNTANARRAQLERVLPHLAQRYNQSHKMLYVGAHLKFGRACQMLDPFLRAKIDVTIIEIFKENVDELKEFGFTNVIHGDIRTFKPREKYDLVMWWHGPEHVSKNEFATVLKLMENYCQGLIICATPNGIYEQGPEYGNEHEKHISTWYLSDWLEIGFDADAIGIPDKQNGNIIAWKTIE